jgi:RNA polymerase sigma-70 factor (ECF subfamily)
MLGDRSSAQDATQDAFFSAWMKIRSCQGTNFRAWLMSITANACRDHLRKIKRRPTIPIESLVQEPAASPAAESPEDYALRRELDAEIQKALSALPSQQRLAVVLCDIQGFSYEEIAKIMGCSLGTVRSRISRGRSQLRDYLSLRELLPHDMRLKQ